VRWTIPSDYICQLLSYSLFHHQLSFTLQSKPPNPIYFSPNLAPKSLKYQS